MIDIKETVNLIIQGARYLALVDSAGGFNIFNYEGRILSSPKYQGLRAEFLNKRSISLSSDVVAILDTSNSKVIRIFDVVSGKATNVNVEHSCDIIEMDLNQTEMSSERKLCFIDANRDMFITMVHKPDIIKIASIVDSFQWNDNNDMLAALSDGKLLCWFYPNAIYVDKDLMTKSMTSKDAKDIGKLAHVHITSFQSTLSVSNSFQGPSAQSVDSTVRSLRFPSRPTRACSTSRSTKRTSRRPSVFADSSRRTRCGLASQQ